MPHAFTVLEEAYESEGLALNITDISDDDVPELKGPEEIANVIFDRQNRLEEIYWKIENRPSQYIEVNSRPAQVLIKDFLWRAMEEMGEHLEAEEFPHRCEELADALHFVTGLCVVLDRRELFVACVEHSLRFYEQKKDDTQTNLGHLKGFVMYSGMLGNCLKMKPWKQTDVLTDETRFNHQLGMYIVAFFTYCYSMGLNLEQMYLLYWKKSEVNLFRQRSKY